jgi:hypothetical protein
MKYRPLRMVWYSIHTGLAGQRYDSVLFVLIGTRQTVGLLSWHSRLVQQRRSIPRAIKPGLRQDGISYKALDVGLLCRIVATII